jgi:MFS transporter, DHA2 family, multidrug resistance protein
VMEMTGTGAAGEQAGRREWIGLAVLALPTLLLSVDISVLYLALPHLSVDLKANSTQQLWIVDIYSFMTAGFLITMGTLGDQIGRRRLLLIGASVFGATSLVAAYSTSPQMLIVTRALMGISAATLLPSTMALIRTMFTHPRQMGTAIGVFFSCFLGGMALGPIVGGLLLDNFWWGSAFLMAIPVMALVLVTAPLLLPEFRNPNPGRLDLASVVLLLAAILPVIYGLKELARTGFHAVLLVSIVVGVIAGAVFLARQGRLATPLLDLQLLRSRIFSTAMSTMLLAGIVMAGVTLLSALYLQEVKGYTPLRAGLWLVPQNIAMIIGSNLAPALARKIRPGSIIAAGLALSALGLGIVTQLHSTSTVIVLVGGITVTALGLALPMTQAGSLVMAAAPPEKAGGAAGLMEASGEFGVALGVASLGSLETFIYRSELPTKVPSLPAGVLSTAREGVSSAITVAGGLPGDLGRMLVAGARAAFTDGLDLVAAVGAGVFLALAILTPVILRHQKPTTPPGQPPPDDTKGVPTTASPGSHPPHGLDEPLRY